MSSDQFNIDLNLWKDHDLFKRQHRLKLQFWEIFSSIAENISDDSLSKICTKHKSKKLSRGNDLLGMPYHVLDIIRNFDPISGLNIRVLNWFGNGIFLLILTGKENSEKVFDFLNANNFLYGLTESPWDYPGLILENQKTRTPDPEMFKKEELQVWVKEINFPEDKSEIIKVISEQINLSINQFSKIFGDNI
jgi:hypothetical protein